MVSQTKTRKIPTRNAAPFCEQAKAGLVAGDLILSLNNKSVSRHADALMIINECKGQLEVVWIAQADAERLAMQNATQHRIAHERCVRLPLPEVPEKRAVVIESGRGRFF